MQGLGEHNVDPNSGGHGPSLPEPPGGFTIVNTSQGLGEAVLAETC